MNCKLTYSKRHLRRKVLENVKRIKDQNSSFAVSYNSCIATDKVPTDQNFLNASIENVLIPKKTVSDNLHNVDIVNIPIQTQPRTCQVHIDYNFEFLPNNNAQSKSLTIDSVVNEKCDELSFLQKFRKWAIDNNVTHRCINELVPIIQVKFPFLKNDARSILGTPRSTETIHLQNGEIIYFGLEKGLLNRLNQNCDVENYLQKTINLQINIDGIPLFHSSSVEFWPILVRSLDLNNFAPFAVSIFCGTGKPCPLDKFLENFIQECLALLEHGINFCGCQYKIKIAFFTCDAPARSYLKQTKGHNSNNACERCTIKCDRLERRPFYKVDTQHISRRDVDFTLDNFKENEHIKEQSPLIRLNVGLVSQFVLDPMHMVHLGVMKRLLLSYWIEGKRPHKFSRLSINKINIEIKKLRKYIPKEFHRKMRTLSDIKRYKALEYRFFLLYCGPFLLKNNQNVDYYDHFILLHAAIFIYSNAVLISKYFIVAKQALEKFVILCPDLYSNFFVVYNVHSLIHIHEDVQNFGPLETYSCYPFESYLGQLKNRVRGKYLPLQQIGKRLQEIEKSTGAVLKSSVDPKEEKFVPINIIKNHQNYFKCSKLSVRISDNSFTLSIEIPDNVVSVENQICVIKHIICIEGIYKCVGNIFKYLDDFYKTPIKSSKLGIYFGKGSGSQLVFCIDKIKCKYMAFSYKNGFYLAPMLHQKLG